MSFYIFHRHSVCLVDRVDLICSLYSWWEDFGSSSLVTLPLGYNCGFISTSGYESSTGVCSWGCPEGLGFAPVRARCGGGTAAWVAGVLSGERLGDEGREAMVMAPPTTHDSAAALALGLLPASASSRRPAFLSGVCMAVGKDCLILILFRLPQISCFTLSLKCFSSDSDSCSAVGIRPLLQFPHPQRAGPVLLTLLFFPLVPSSYGVLRDSIYSFPLVRYFSPLSAGGLHALLCLKVYSWCICGERCTPHPPTPLPSCSLEFLLKYSDVALP